MAIKITVSNNKELQFIQEVINIGKKEKYKRHKRDLADVYGYNSTLYHSQMDKYDKNNNYTIEYKLSGEEKK